MALTTKAEALQAVVDLKAYIATNGELKEISYCSIDNNVKEKVYDIFERVTVVTSEQKQDRIEYNSEENTKLALEKTEVIAAEASIV